MDYRLEQIRSDMKLTDTRLVMGESMLDCMDCYYADIFAKYVKEDGTLLKDADGGTEYDLSKLKPYVRYRYSDELTEEEIIDLALELSNLVRDIVVDWVKGKKTVSK